MKKILLPFLLLITGSAMSQQQTAKKERRFKRTAADASSS